MPIRLGRRWWPQRSVCAPISITYTFANCVDYAFELHHSIQHADTHCDAHKQ